MATIYHLHFYVKACLHFDQYSRVFFFFFFFHLSKFLSEVPFFHFRYSLGNSKFTHNNNN